jgi:hypothetical protein
MDSKRGKAGALAGAAGLRNEHVPEQPEPVIIPRKTAAQAVVHRRSQAREVAVYDGRRFCGLITIVGREFTVSSAWGEPLGTFNIQRTALAAAVASGARYDLSS